jgi:predicted Zn-dependent protease with MMP-like domain
MRMNQKLPEELLDLIENFLMKIPRKNGIQVLDDVIFDTSKKLKGYVDKGNVNIHIKQQYEKRIADLIYVYDRLQELTLHELWKRVEEEISSLENRDKNIDGFHIIIRRKFDGENFGHIELTI